MRKIDGLHPQEMDNKSVQVVYYIPDYLNLVNEFICKQKTDNQTIQELEDFLDHWDKNIDGPIKETIHL